MLTETFIQSTDQETPIHVATWTPTKSPVAIIQLVHGMSEYITRYDEFANFLNQHRILVVGHDHLGHGLSIHPEKKLYGYFNETDSVNCLVEDCYQVFQQTKETYPHLPYFILGHSMGSFITRIFLTKYASDLQGAIIMGSASHHTALPLALALTEKLNELDPTNENPTLNKLAFGSFSKFFDSSSPFSWLSKNQQNVKTYEADPLMGFVFTNNGFHTLFSLMNQATQTNWYQGIPKHLPILLISGEKDPVGSFGKGPVAVANELAQASFEQITLQLYPDLRHEILNEKEKELVMTDIYTWLTKHV